jgi:hypothetical protein
VSMACETFAGNSCSFWADWQPITWKYHC